MTSALITVLLISIIMPLIFRANDSVTKTENNGRIVFEFSKALKTTMLICTIVFIIVSLIFFIVALNSQKGEIIAVIIFALFSLFSSFIYLLLRNKKIIYDSNILYVYNIIGKQKSFNIQDIKEAIEIPSDGMKLIFKDNQTIKVDVQMMNYSEIKEILDKNNIIYKDKNGNNAPKGW